MCVCWGEAMQGWLWLCKAHNVTMTWQHLCYKLRLLKRCPLATHYTISSGHFLLKPLIKFEWLQKYSTVNSYMTASKNCIMPAGRWLIIIFLFLFSTCSQLPGMLVGPHNVDIYYCLYSPLLSLYSPIQLYLWDGFISQIAQRILFLADIYEGRGLLEKCDGLANSVDQ